MKKTIEAPVKNTTTGKKAQSTKLTKGANGMELKVTKPKKEIAPVFLRDGVTGKQFIQELYKSSAEYRQAIFEEHKSASGAKNMFKKFYEQNFINSIVNYNERIADKPNLILEFKTEREKSFKGTSAYTYAKCVKRYFLALLIKK
jgi:hypothetical protein